MALRVQFLRVVLSFCEGDASNMENKLLLLSPAELKHLGIPPHPLHHQIGSLDGLIRKVRPHHSLLALPITRNCFC